MAHRKKPVHPSALPLARRLGDRSFTRSGVSESLKLENVQNVTNWLAPYDLGPSPSDERHRGVVSGLVEMPWGIKFAPIMQIASARPYNPVEGTDYFGYGTGGTVEQAVLLKSDPNNYQATAACSATQLQSCLSAATCYIAGYNSARGKPFFQFDAHLSKIIRFHERMSLSSSSRLSI